jgi:putative phage-type endonuclease
MSEKKVKKPTSQKNVDVIIANISDSSKKYTLDEFDNLVDKMHKEIKEVIDYKKVRKIICKHAVVKNNKISFDTETETDTTYKSLRKDLESVQKKDNEKKKEKVSEKKKSGFFNLAKNVVSEDEDEDDVPDMSTLYKMPEQKLNITKKTDKKFGPYGTQWIHDVQTDDIIDSKIKETTETVRKLMAIEYPEQRSEAWFAMREKCVSASDGGCVIGENHYEQPYKFLVKKVQKPPFESNMFCHHGCKYENIATMIYEYRMNVKVEEFGLVAHPKYSFLAASPDGIVGKYKLDGKSLTKHVGTMLEIKCPFRRKIKQTGEIKGEICPIYYWVQVQLQLECCNLEECAFWQCDIQEYEDRDEFMRDTDENEPFRSKLTQFEKGCVIQLLPKDKIEDIKNGKYLDILYGSSKYLYPPKIEMSPMDCDIWIAECMANFNTLCPKGYYFDRIIYWKLATSNCSMVIRDKKWFKEKLPEFEKMWNYVVYLREHKEKADLLFSYIDNYPKKAGSNPKIMEEINEKVMEIMEFMYNEPSDDNPKEVKKYASKIIELTEEVEENKKILQKKAEEEMKKKKLQKDSDDE